MERPHILIEHFQRLGSPPPTLAAAADRSGQALCDRAARELRLTGVLLPHGKPVGLPESEYGAIASDLADVFREYEGLLGNAPVEFKHSEFKRLDLKARRRLAVRLRDILLPRGCFVGGFYTPVRSYVLEQVRTDLLLDRRGERVPDELGDLYVEAVNELKALQVGPGDSSMITRLLQVPMAGVGNLLASLKCPFEVIYDPRGKKEDKAVRAGVSE